MTPPPATPGPNEINQVVTAATAYGVMARCGCGWRALHPTKLESLVSGQRHTRTHTESTSEQ